MNTTITDINIDEDIQAFMDLADNFALKELAENRGENDCFPFGELYTGAIDSAAKVGFYGINLPEDYGGIGMNTSALAAILEKISRVDASMAGIIFTNAAALEIVRIASEESDCGIIYKKITETGTIPIAFQSYESPETIEMPVINQNGRISGKIDFLVLAGISRYAVVNAKNSNGRVSYYLVDLQSSGIKKNDTVHSLGLHACPAVDIVFEDVPVDLIGIEGNGHDYFLEMQSRMSVAACAISVGIMKGSFEEALQYTKDRFQGGRQIVDWAEVRMLLANFAIEVMAGESCLFAAIKGLDLYQAGWEKTARAAAIHVAEMACRATVDGVQLLGGNGYMKDYDQEKRMRDAKQVQALLGMAPLRKMNYIDAIIAEGE